MAIVFIFADLEVADYVSGACGGEIDIHGVEGHGGWRGHCEESSRLVQREMVHRCVLAL